MISPSMMLWKWPLVLSASASLSICLQARATNLVTGNGFGFAVVVPQSAEIHSFYAHPYSFERPDPTHPLSEGIATPNFLKSLKWGDDPVRQATAQYEQDSQVIHMRSSAGEGFAWMPFGLQRAALIVDWQSAKATAGNFHVKWALPVTSHEAKRFAGISVEILRFKGIDRALLLIPLEGAGSIHQNAQVLSGSPSWAFVSLEQDGNPDEAVREIAQWHAALNTSELVRREIAELEQWRAMPTVHFTNEQERHLWRQSEVMLRMAQCREPNTERFHGNGLIVASLPDGVWSTPWVRDMAWATAALVKMGHRDEARAALLAYFNAQPTGKMRALTRGADYQISVVRYFGDGEEEPYFTEEGSTNIEFDDWGEVLWVLAEYEKKYNDNPLLQSKTHRGQLYESARDFVAKPLLANLEPFNGGEIVPADTSLWEERQKDKKHFAFSTAMAIVGLRQFAALAQQYGDKKTSSEVLRHVALLQKGFNSAFIRGGELKGTLEEGVKNDIDGALLEIIHLGVVQNESLIRNTLQRMELLRVDSGGYRRVRSTYTDPKIFEYWYERQEFLFVDFSLAEVERQLGEHRKADTMLRRIVDKAASDHNIVPEMYVALDCSLFPGNIGDPTGARPMVGYGAGKFILDLLDRESTHSPGN